MGQKAFETEIRNACADVATEEKHEAEGGEERSGTLRLAPLPAPAQVDIRDQEHNIESGKDEDRGEVGDENTSNDKTESDGDESDEILAEFGLGDAPEMDDLSDEEATNAGFSGVVAGENDVGDKSNE